MQKVHEKTATDVTVNDLNRKLDVLIKIGMFNNRILMNKFEDGIERHKEFKAEIEKYLNQ